MLIEALVALSLVGLILTAVAEVHQTIAHLTSSAISRETREKELVAEHFKDPSPESECSTKRVIPSVVDEICCDLEILIEKSKKTGRACKLTSDSGSALINFIMASFFLTLLGALSYPTLRQLMIERKESRDSQLIKLSVAETESELERVMFDNQVFRLPGITRVLPIADPLVRPAIELTNKNYSPNRSSSILITTDLEMKNLIYPFRQRNVLSNAIEFLSCSSLPKTSEVVAGFYRDHWAFFTIISRKKINVSDCNSATSFELSKLDGDAPIDPELLGLAPIKQSELYYLDNDNSLRRYSLIQKRTTPIDHGLSRFSVVQLENTFHFELTKKIKDEEREFSFDISLEVPNGTSLLSTLL